jgi:hypothetical protein
MPRGRDALRAILTDIGCAPGDKVLLPAFSCPSLAETAVSMGMEPVFYPVNERLEADAGTAVRKSEGRCRAVLYINYFGFPQGQEAVLRLKETGLPLIEDATHSLFTGSPEAPWDYRFASLRKLLPVPEGCLVESKKPLGIHGTAPGGVEERMNSFLRALGLRAAERYRRRPSGFLKWLSGALFYRAHAALDGNRPLGYVSGMTTRVLAGADPEGIRRRRRENYLALAGALSPATGLRPVMPELPEGVCPVSLPVRAQNRELWRRALAALDIESSAQWPLHPAADAGKFSGAAALAREMLVLPASHHLEADEVQEMARLINGLAA